VSGDILTPGEIIARLFCPVCGQWLHDRGCRECDRRTDHYRTQVFELPIPAPSPDCNSIVERSPKRATDVRTAVR
jgi:predicted RNA-binding Zn-ribbon protein involved in translation (DUF1610 family)